MDLIGGSGIKLKTEGTNREVLKFEKTFIVGVDESH